MRVGVQVRRRAVGRPAGVADAGGAGRQSAVPRLLAQLGDTPADLLHLNFPAMEHRDPGGVIAPVFEPLQSPEQDGVGIAAPQVGISRRLAWVQRYDKPGEPWELYPNIRILERSGAVSHDPEGCLSVPPQRAVVPRYGTVIVSWTDPQTLQERRDTVHGYTAVIFQHECDHMEGTVCTDRADSVSVNEAWAAERAAFLEKGAYRKPAWWE